MPKLTPSEARLDIWSKLRKVAELIASMDIYKNAKVTFITPDNNLEKFREIAFKDKKTVIMTNNGITRGFFMIKPGDIPDGKKSLPPF